MCEGYAETCYGVTPECPICNVELDGEAEVLDAFIARPEKINYILKCRGCETRLELVINHETPTHVEIWVTPED